MARRRVPVDVTGALLRFAAARPRPFLVAGVSGVEARLAAETELDGRGWRPAAAPSEANLLVVCANEHDPVVAFADRVWEGLAAPRARAAAATAADVPGALAASRESLARPPAQDQPPHAEGHEGHDMGAMGHDMQGMGHDMEGMGHDMEGMGHDMQGMSHDMGGMEIGGLRIPDRAPDRDGLKLDVLEVPLGPALADWPAGLVVRTRLQGDVVQSAEVETLLPHHAASGPFWADPGRGLASRLDSLSRLLVVAGWPTAARRARRLRASALARDTGDLAHEVERLATVVRRSRTLRWLTNGLGVVPERAAVAAGAPSLAGDATARWGRWLADALTLASGDALDDRPPAQAAIELLPDALVGTELAGARLVVASFDPDVGELAPASHAHG